MFINIVLGVLSFKKSKLLYIFLQLSVLINSIFRWSKTNAQEDQFMECTSSEEISCDVEDVKFYLYSNPLNESDFDEIEHLNSTYIEKSRFKPGKDLIILIHGFIQNYTSVMPSVLKNKYLEMGYSNFSNIICVQWGKLSGAYLKNPPLTISFSNFYNNIYYFSAVDNIEKVGRKVAEFIQFLVREKISDPTSTHLVGHSLGAHISGIAGRIFNNLTGTLLNRITGLDPAGPLFQPWFIFRSTSEKVVLESDATFVDIYHSNQGSYGFIGSLGHVDFYINGGGPFQPGCFVFNFSDPYCAHQNVLKYYSKSIGSDNMIAKSLSCYFTYFYNCSTAIFGENCQITERGAYFISVGNE